MTTAITVENLSKAYRIGLTEEIPDTLLSAATGLLKAPLRKFKELRHLDTSMHSHHSESIHWALRDVSFEVREGEVLGVIGRNGAGKSTLLKILSRITEPTSGRATIRGRVSSLLEVGTGFHPELSGRENVYLNGTILGMTKKEIDRKFDEIVEFSGVEKYLDTPIKRYSSGMKVRLAFAVAAHLEPEILIIDEVLAVGDAEFQKKCMGKMQDVAGEGRTVLFVSHNIPAVSNLCRTGCVIEAGSMIASGDIDDCVTIYLKSQIEVSADSKLSSSDLNRTRVSEVAIQSQDTESALIYVTDTIEFRVAIIAHRLIENARLAIRVFDSLGNRVVTLHTDYQHPETIHIDANTEVELFCALRNCRLAPGTYTVDIQFDEGRNTIELLTACRSFDIQHEDLYGTGKSFPARTTIVYGDTQWSINPISMQAARSLRS
ncbi:Teichoic acids export ATP-binding protein TagH [Rosistilla ulvae]|uniref:Teichoic acids export ATP-binding protein TagH n=1 Tax=Rosistilla ulvae TaxID=1930277 RepID=A0A517M0E5_9BACT|nr:ABC transporter ATP-binding protein [Rosistilla ulvae]QDS88350.1 Teichoic acids export ATP-binding protein TagH [Rosistilla ulvae]